MTKTGLSDSDIGLTPKSTITNALPSPTPCPPGLSVWSGRSCDLVSPSNTETPVIESTDLKDLSDRAASFIAEVFREWSEPNDFVKRRFGDLYSGQISYYGNLKTRRQPNTESYAGPQSFP